LSHQNSFAVLNNHNRYGGTTNTVFGFTFDDSGGGQYINSRPTDGPGSLNNFVGERIAGGWLFTMIDDAPGKTGRVDGLTIRAAPQQDILGAGVDASVLANEWVYFFVDVPVDADKLTVLLSSVSGGPLNLYVKRGAPPTTTDFDKFALINPPGGS